MGVHHTATWSTNPTTGNALKAAPWGLGHLLVGGYLADCRTFYCPSVGDTFKWPEMEYDRQFSVDGNGSHRITDWKNAGGYDARALTNGMWRYANGNPAANYDQFIGIYGNYDYRNVPAVPGQNQNPTGLGAADFSAAALNVWNTYPIKVHWTKPTVYTTMNAPSFKTPKALGGRALVVDSFGKSANYGNSQNFIVTRPGFNYYSHRDGYNVLYGDWSARWYGDPQQRMIWWPGPLHTSQGGTFSSVSQYGLASVRSTLSGIGIADDTQAIILAGAVWHMFDVAVSVDTDAAF